MSRRGIGRVIACASLCLAVGAAGGGTPAWAGGLARYVNPFAGTERTARTLHFGKTNPGPTMPFGMIQWSPDLGNRGYEYKPDAQGPGQIQGLSLTHISGAGCPIYQDFPFMPTTARIGASPARGRGPLLDRRFAATFSHTQERASPGFYSVTLNPGAPGSIRAQLTSTTRTALGRFEYPRGRSPRMLINAGGSANADRLAKIHIHPGHHEVSGVATSGHFCHQRPLYRIYFAARFSRRFKSHGTWQGSHLRRGSKQAKSRRSGSRTARAGAYLTFGTKPHNDVGVRVAVSFVSAGNALSNLEAENFGRSFHAIRAGAARAWDRMLGRARVGGGSRSDRRTFYTDLYHLMVAPRTFSDANGQYIGMDDRVHDAIDRVQYADFSGWDVYRSDFPLLALLLPARTGDIVESLLVDAQQSGCLPKWSLANGQTMEMVGDPADPAIASAAAFGARGFDTADALQAMLAGATQTCQSPNGDYVERQGLSSYLSHGYIPYELNVQRGGATSATGSPDAVRASAATTLEYLSDDFAIAQFAARVRGDAADYGPFMQRAAKWVDSFNPATRYIQPRRADGSFPHLRPRSKEGFAEGSAAQYTWMVPYDLAGLTSAIGGRRTTARRLNRFLTKLNASKQAHSPHAVLGNEPSLGAPWVYDWIGRPYATQRTVRRAIRTLYSGAPHGYPGNDDLGELSSWYLFGALGLYPEVPGAGVLALGSPLFPRARIRLPGGRLVITAHGAASRHPYVRSLSLNGNPYAKPWVSYCELAGGARLRYRLGARPKKSWGARPQDAPPSFDTGTPFPSDPCAF